MTKPIMPGLNRDKIDMGSKGKILSVKHIKSFKSVTLANHPLSVYFLNSEVIRKEMKHEVYGIGKGTDKNQVKNEIEVHIILL